MIVNLDKKLISSWKYLGLHRINRTVCKKSKGDMLPAIPSSGETLSTPGTTAKIVRQLRTAWL
jgi:hypothetical protein